MRLPAYPGALVFNAHELARWDYSDQGGMLYRLVLCVSLTQAGVITEKGASGEGMPP